MGIDTLFVHALYQGPIMLVLLVGLVLIATRRLPRRAKSLGLSACILLLVTCLASMAWAVALPSLMTTRTVAEYGLLLGVVGALFTILEAVGFALLIAAVVAGRTKPVEVSETAAGVPAAPGG